MKQKYAEMLGRAILVASAIGMGFAFASPMFSYEGDSVEYGYHFWYRMLFELLPANLRTSSAHPQALLLSVPMSALALTALLPFVFSAYPPIRAPRKMQVMLMAGFFGACVPAPVLWFFVMMAPTDDPATPIAPIIFAASLVVTSVGLVVPYVLGDRAPQ